MKLAPCWQWNHGAFVRAEPAALTFDDRSFRFGDGLFETLRCYRRVPFRWADHLDRMLSGCNLLRLSLPGNPASITAGLQQFFARQSQEQLVARLHLSRGPGPRGLSPGAVQRPLLVITLHPPPPAVGAGGGLRVATTRWTLPGGLALALCKSASRLPYLLARLDAEAAGAQQGLLRNPRGEVVEADSANLFWIEDHQVCTPPLSSGALDGITRRTVLELCADLGIAAREQALRVSEVPRLQVAFLTSSVLELAPVTHLDDRPLNWHPWVDRLLTAYRARALDARKNP
jgi:branched-chain amino acid aminotransferase